MLRWATLNLLRDNDASNVSMCWRKMRAACNHDYCQNILFG